MQIVLLVAYGAVVFAAVFAFFHFARGKNDPGRMPLVMASLAMLAVVGLGGHDLWWLETQVNYGVSE